MTFSIVARSDDGDSLGVAVASKFLAVGSAVPAARLGVGAVATQSFCNTLYKRDGLERQIDALRQKKTTLADAEYYRQLDVLLLQLARIQVGPGGKQ